MEIDLPRAPIESVKDFFLHIFTITVGILIALGLEQSLEAYHHYQLANEARANIVSELRDNKNNVDAVRGRIPELIKEPQSVLQIVNQALAHSLQKTPKMGLHFDLATTTSTSWTTAQAVGALTYMNYQEVKEFSETYQMQQRFEDVQKAAFDATIAAISTVGVPKAGMETWSHQDLENARQQLQRCSAADQAYEQFAAALSKEYADVLSKHVTNK